jgi:hypothetical protein
MSFETTRRIRRARLGLDRLNSLLKRENVQLSDADNIALQLRDREIASLEHSVAVSDVKEICKNAGYIARVYKSIYK